MDSPDIRGPRLAIRPLSFLMRSLALPLPATDLEALRFRVKRLADDRPGTYRMLGADGRVLYVGKAKALRTRLLSYFRAAYPEDKGARILHAASDIRIDPTPSEFAAALAELELIRKHRPPFNVAMNRNRSAGFLVVTDERAPRLVATAAPERHRGRVYGPFPSRARILDASRVLMDLLGIRYVGALCGAAGPLRRTRARCLPPLRLWYLPRSMCWPGLRARLSGARRHRGGLLRGAEHRADWPGGPRDGRAGRRRGFRACGVLAREI